MPTTVVFHLKFATLTFLPALADPYAYIYKQDILDKDPNWYMKNIMGSGPFKFVEYELGQSIKGERNPDYYHKGQPYLDGFIGIYADKQVVRTEAIRGDRATTEFRGLPPSAIDQLKKELGDKVTIQTSDWNCGNLITPNSKKKPFDDVRVRKALLLAIDQWHGAPALSKIANVHTVGGIVFPGSPLAATKEELQQMAGFWPDIDKSRAEAKRLLKEAGQENLSFEMLNRNVDQPYKYVGTWIVDEWSKIGVKVTQKVVPTGPWFEAMRTGNFDVVVEANCNGVVNPVMDTQKYLPKKAFVENYGGYDDQDLIDIYDKMLHETDPAKQRLLMRAYETRVVDTMAYEWPMLWWNRMLPERSYMHGWKIGPSHYVNQDLATIWLTSRHSFSPSPCAGRGLGADARVSRPRRLRVHVLVDLDDIALGIVEEDLMPAVHRPLAVVGIGDVLLLEPPLEGRNVIGAEGDVTALERIDDVLGAEADAEVLGGQMYLGLAVGHEGDRGGVALRGVACAVQ